MKALNIATAVLLGALSAADAVADGRNPGSVLVYPVIRTDLGFTIVTVTNSATNPATPNSFGESTNLHFHYTNVTSHPLLITRAQNCTVFDRVEFLTPADTLSVMVNCHNPSGPDGNKGYLVVSAENPAAAFTPWDHDHLIGSAAVILKSGVMYQYNAFAIEALTGPGNPTDISPTNGVLDFDGVEYEQLPDCLTVDSFHTLYPHSLALINLTGQPLDVNTVYLSVWNDNEFALSLTINFSCWFHERMEDINILFTQDFLSLLPNDPEELDCHCNGTQEAETGWIKLQSVGVRRYPAGLDVAEDGAILGLITTNNEAGFGGRLLWESGRQNNGNFGLSGPTDPSPNN